MTTSGPGEAAADLARSPAKRLLYLAVRAITTFVARTYWRMSVEGSEHLPRHGPFIVAPVHRSIVDTFVVAGLSRRRLRFMGKQELWKHAAAGWFLSALGGFPVHRGGADREALRRCIDVLGGGEPLVIFPEGTRRSGPVVAPLFEGAAYVAARTGVPIVPIGIAGTEDVMPKGSKMIRPAKVRVVIGPPVPPPTGAGGGRATRRQLHETTEELHQRLQALFDRARAQT